jgi:hypothetical protein
LILEGILSALPIPEGNHSHWIPVPISPLLSPHASPSLCSIKTQYESIRTQCEIVEAVKSITAASPLKQEEDHKPSHNNPVGNKLQIDNLSSSNTTRLGGMMRPSEESQQKQISFQSQLQALPYLIRGIDVHLTTICAIFSIILYYVCKVCMYVIQDKVKDIIYIEIVF